MDGIERDVGDRARVVRVEIRTAAGEAVQERYGLSITPTFVVFDRGGDVRLRTSQPTAAGDALRGLAAGR